MLSQVQEQFYTQLSKDSDTQALLPLENYVKTLVEKKNTEGITWAEISRLVSKIYGVNRDESVYRKKYGHLVTPKEPKSVTQEEAAMTSTVLREMRKERAKIADERTQNNAYIRRLAREETLKEIAAEAVNKIADKRELKPLLPFNPEVITKNIDNEGILMLSDWHYGLECENYWNKYNLEIARQRISKLRDEVLLHCTNNGVTRLHVLNLADLIAGRIHLTIRLESRIDVITQVMETSEILAELLVNLSGYFPIDYYSCLDNHSRLEPNKSDSLELESLCRITDWYLKSRLASFDKIHIHDNIFGEDIITFKCKNYSVLGVHGDKDKPTQIIDSLSRMTQEHFDLICTAHLHHFSCDEKNNTVVVCNGSVLGTDTYAKNYRLSSKPSQNLIIVSDKSVCEAIYRILLV